MRLVKYFSSRDWDSYTHTRDINAWIMEMEADALKTNKYFRIVSHNFCVSKSFIITEIWFDTYPLPTTESNDTVENLLSEKDINDNIKLY